MKVQVHPTAVIDEGACIGPGTRIWHFSHVCAGACIGVGCTLGQNVFVGGQARIGDRVKIQNNVSVYDAVTLEDEVFCGPGVVFTNVYNPRATVDRRQALRPTRVGRGATLGANCTLVCGATVGEWAFVGAGAVVRDDVPAFALMAGVPARQIGWVSRHGQRLDLPLQGQAQAVCPDTGELYVLREGVCRWLPLQEPA